MRHDICHLMSFVISLMTILPIRYQSKPNSYVILRYMYIQPDLESSIWHSIWHIFRHFLSDMLSDMLSDVLSDIWWMRALLSWPPRRLRVSQRAGGDMDQAVWWSKYTGPTVDGCEILHQLIISHYLPVVPHLRRWRKFQNRKPFSERLVVVNHGSPSESTDWPKGGWNVFVGVVAMVAVVTSPTTARCSVVYCSEK